MEEVNCLEGKNLTKNGLLDGQGFVKIIKVSPETHPKGYTPEYLVAKAARASYGSDNKSAKADRGLVEFLIRNQHTSPLEMCSVTFCLKLPIAICRQLLRHRTGKFNEFSQRYSEVTEEVNRLRLDNWSEGLRGKSAVNHQASEFNLAETQKANIEKKLKRVEELQDEVFDIYQGLLEDGLAKEVARFVLPVSTYTTIFVQFDLNNLMKFFRLRCAEDAQYEIQVYAKAMRELVQQFFPISMNMHLEYEGSLSLGKWEKIMIKERRLPKEVTSKTHQRALLDLAKQLNIELKVD
jgi:thymidylate synthase (FAD)